MRPMPSATLPDAMRTIENYQREKIDDDVEADPVPSHCMGICRRLGRRLEPHYLAVGAILTLSHPAQPGRCGV
jgi:hypothetical protein